MSRPELAAGFVGNLVDFRPQRGTRLLTATVVLPHRDLDRFHQAVGMPAAGVDVEREPDACPALALIPAEHPRHPRTHDEALLQAALLTVERLLDAGNVRIDPRTACRVNRLRRALNRLPLHAEVSGEAAHGL